MSSENKIKAVFIFEVLGHPAEHLIEVLETMIKAISEEKGVNILQKDIKEPQEVEQQKGLYSTFAEVEVGLESVMHVAMIMFKYMPAHVEVIEPENIMMNNGELSELFSELTRRLHAYDEIARVIQHQKAQLEQKIKELGGEEKKEDSKEKKKVKTKEIKKEK